VFVKDDNFIRRRVSDNRQLAPASADRGHIVQESSFALLVVEPRKPLLDSSLRCDYNGLAGELRQPPHEVFGLGVINIESHTEPRIAA
jgi:hypothetical protein